MIIKYNSIFNKILDVEFKVCELKSNLPKFLVTKNLMLPIYEDIIENKNMETISNKLNVNLRFCEEKLHSLYSGNLNTLKLGKLKLSKLEELKFLLANKGYYINFSDKITKESLKLINMVIFQRSYIDTENNLLKLTFMDKENSLKMIDIYYQLIEINNFK